MNISTNFKTNLVACLTLDLNVFTWRQLNDFIKSCLTLQCIHLVNLQRFRYLSKTIHIFDITFLISSWFSWIAKGIQLLCLPVCDFIMFPCPEHNQTTESLPNSLQIQRCKKRNGWKLEAIKLREPVIPEILLITSLN